MESVGRWVGAAAVALALPRASWASSASGVEGDLGLLVIAFVLVTVFGGMLVVQLVRLAGGVAGAPGMVARAFDVLCGGLAGLVLLGCAVAFLVVGVGYVAPRQVNPLVAVLSKEELFCLAVMVLATTWTCWQRRGAGPQPVALLVVLSLCCLVSGVVVQVATWMVRTRHVVAAFGERPAWRGDAVVAEQAGAAVVVGDVKTVTAGGGALFAARRVDLTALATGEPMRSFEGPDEIASLALADGERLLVAGGRTGTVRIWSLADGTVVRDVELGGATKGRRDVLVAGAGRRPVALVAERSGPVVLLDLATGERRDLVAPVGGDEVRALAIDGDGAWAAAACGKKLTVVSLAAGAAPRTVEQSFLPAALAMRTSAGTSPLVAAVGYDHAKRSGAVVVYDVATGTQTSERLVSKTDIRDVAFGPDGATLFGACAGRRVVAWSVDGSGDGRCVLRLPSSTALSVAVDGGGGRLVTGWKGRHPAVLVVPL